MTDTKLMERIVKLHAKAVSAREIGSIAEAEAFMSAVQKMLAEHDMTISEVEFNLSLTQDVVQMQLVVPEMFGEEDGRSGKLHQKVVAYSVAELFNCRFLNHGDSGRAFFIIGRSAHREIAIFMVTTLLRTMEDMADKEYVRYFYACKRAGDVTRARGFRQGFVEGFAKSIMERCKQLMAQRAGSVGTALVRVNQEKQKIDDFFDQMRANKQIVQKALTVTRRRASLAGLKAGEDAGQQVSLTPNVMQGSAGAAKRLSTG